MKMKKLFERIPRPVRATVCTVCAVLLAVCYYIALGCPTTFRQEFRRAEKAHLVGPSKIVDRLDGEYDEYDKMIVGETEYGICFFGRHYNSFPYDNPFDEKQYDFSYIRKTGDLTLVAAPNVWGGFWPTIGGRRYLPVYLFADEQESVRAEVEITVTGTYHSDNVKDSSFTETFRGEAKRSEKGFFCFGLSANQEVPLHALQLLSGATGGGSYSHGYKDHLSSITAIVRLYDEKDNCILERQMELFSNP